MSPRHLQWFAEDYHRMAINHRESARLYLRWGDGRSHREFMHMAVRAWRNFAHYQRKLNCG